MRGLARVHQDEVLREAEPPGEGIPVAGAGPGGCQDAPVGDDLRRLRVAEMIATLEAPYYVERTAMDCAKNVLKTRNAIKKAFQYQMEGRGFTFVEVLSLCPTNWGMDPLKAVEWVSGPMQRVFPVGVFKDKGKAAA
jgi:hypothetical protein